jgi:predicted nucleic acid-binding protein
MKYIIFDSGPLINFAMNGSLYILERLKKEFDGDFLITKEVKQEIIDTPLTIKKFELEALQLKSLYDRGIIKLADITPQQVDELRKKRDEITNTANTTFKTKKRYIHLIDKGESAVLALSKIINPNLIVVDERTTRILCENPENLKKLLEKKLHTSVIANKKNYSYFKDYKIIRSTELAYIAYKKEFFDIKDSRILEAILYGLKYKGCSISEEEIEEIKNS